MDPDGTLHNLRPISRLAVTGPDIEPRRPGDTEFGSQWFSAKEKAEAEAAAKREGPAELPTRKRVKRVDAPARDGEAGAPDHVEIDLTGLLGGIATADGRAGDTGQAHQAGTESGAAQQTGANPATWPPAGETAALTAAGTAGPHGEAETTPGPHAEASTPQADPAHAETSEADDGQGDPGAAAAGQGDGGAARADGGPRVVPLPTAAAVKPLLEEATGDAAETAAGQDARRHDVAAVDLQAIRWRLDGGTLREVVDDKEALRELGERLDKPLADDAGRVAKAALLSIRAEVYRLLGELGMAAAASRLALAHAESAQDVRSMVIAQAELAHVLRLRGDFVEADRLFARAANTQVPEPLRSVVHENAGRCCFDQGRHMEALDHFARAVRLGRPDDTDLAERIGVCLEAVYIHVLRDGWGPYPRRSLDILGVTGRTQPSSSVRPARPDRPAPDAFDKRGTLNETTAERPVVLPR